MKKILIYPDTSLRIKTEEIVEMTDKLRFEIDEAFRVLSETSNAAAIAANQLGFKSRFFVYRSQFNDPKVVINPRLEFLGKISDMKEGCLSFPGLKRHVKRNEMVQASYCDEQFNRWNIGHAGFLAQVFQHECDHLDGKLFIDDLPKSEREKIAQKMIRR